MYPVVTTTETPLSNNPTTTNTTTTTMSRNRSLSATSSQSPALLSRGFASLRRAHRRLSHSSPSSPTPAGSGGGGETTQPTVPLSVITDEQQQNNRPRSLENNSSTEADAISVVRPRIRLVPNVGLSSRSFVFDIIDREFEPGTIYRIGRFSDRNALTERLSFKSKVVSRNHAELWTDQGKVYLRDIGSSSGTFLNRIRLSPPSQISEPHEVKDGDTIQLGVDYQGGVEPIYRAVRIRVEINRQAQSANSPFARTAFQQLRSHLIGTGASSTSPIGSPTSANDLPSQFADLGLHREPTKVYEENSSSSPPNLTTPLADMMSRHNITDISRSEIQECCICLYAIAPFQALFVAPCSHVFHFKCLRPIVFQNYPGFSCPLCRSYFDLEASVAIEVDEVLEAINSAKEQQQQKQDAEKASAHPHALPIDTVPELNEEEDGEEGMNSHLDVSDEGADQPESSNQSNRESEEEEEEVEGPVGDLRNRIKNRLGNTPPSVNITTPPVPYITVPDENDQTPSLSANATTQAIDVSSSENGSHLQAHPRANRSREALLSTTLVETPTIDDTVLPSTSNNVVS